jgi:adenosine deaminase/aminodeoxyfutalosine deaminase
MATAPTPSSFIRSLPKAELHLHLEGSVTPATLLELQQQQGVPGANLASVEALYQYTDFTGFLLSFKNITEFLRSPADYELIAYRLLEQLHAQTVRHAEVTVSVGVCLWRHQDFGAIFEGLERARARGEKDFHVSVLWIFDAVRQFGPEKARAVAELAAHYYDRGVTAFGIGGDERRAGPELFREVYAYAADQGLHLTAHAGETVGPESIWGALNLRSERLGHGLTAAQDAELLQELSERQVPIEVCLTSNLRTGCCQKLEEHPLREFFEHGVMVTLSTDDPAMFGCSLNGEYALAQRLFEFTDEQLREIARNSFEASFLPDEKKVEFLNLFDAAVSAP